MCATNMRAMQTEAGDESVPVRRDRGWKKARTRGCGRRFASAPATQRVSIDKRVGSASRHRSLKESVEKAFFGLAGRKAGGEEGVRATTGTSPSERKVVAMAPSLWKGRSYFTLRVDDANYPFGKEGTRGCLHVLRERNLVHLTSEPFQPCEIQYSPRP